MGGRFLFKENKEMINDFSTTFILKRSRQELRQKGNVLYQISILLK